MITIAQLDKNGLLVGYLKKDAAADGDIVVPDNCDLALKQYRWDAARETFVPLAARARPLEAAPDALHAIALALLAVRDGKPLPAQTLEWLAWYERSWDYTMGGQPR